MNSKTTINRTTQAITLDSSSGVTTVGVTEPFEVVLCVVDVVSCTLVVVPLLDFSGRLVCFSGRLVCSSDGIVDVVGFVRVVGGVMVVGAEQLIRVLRVSAIHLSIKIIRFGP